LRFSASRDIIIKEGLTMKTFRTVFLVLLFVVLNYYGVKFTFLGLNYASDYAFVGGLFGGAVLLVVDFLIIRSVIRNYAAKVEALWQDGQPASEVQAATQSATAPSVQAQAQPSQASK
jgi:hypothetical protein